MRSAWEIFKERGVIVPGHEDEIARKLDERAEAEDSEELGQFEYFTEQTQPSSSYS